MCVCVCVCVCVYLCVFVCVYIFSLPAFSIRVGIFSNFYSYLRIIFFHRILFCKFFYYKNNRLEVFLKKSTEELSQSSTTQKLKFSIKDFFSKCDQIRRKLTEEILFCGVETVFLYAETLLSPFAEKTLRAIRNKKQ